MFEPARSCQWNLYAPLEVQIFQTFLFWDVLSIHVEFFVIGRQQEVSIAFPSVEDLDGHPVKNNMLFSTGLKKKIGQSLEWNLHFTKWNFVLTAGKMFCLSMTLTFMMMVMKVLESILSRENRTLYAFSPRLLVSKKRIMS